MKRIFLSLAAVLIASVSVAQQNDNAVFTCAKGTLTYEKPDNNPSKLKKVTGVIGAVSEAMSGGVYNSEDHGEYAPAVNDAVGSGFLNSFRVKLSDGTDNPDLIYDGTISSITVSRKAVTEQNSNGAQKTKYEFAAHVIVSVNLKDAQTKDLIRTFSLNETSSTSSIFASAEDAFNDVVKRICRKVTASVNEMYPLYASFLEKGASDKELYVDLGSNFGLESGFVFTVYQTSVIAGKDVRKEIGKLKIKEVLGDEISLCKITKGDKNIKKALDEGNPILIVGSDYGWW